MNTDLFEIVGKIAGIAGISLGVLLLIFREIIRRNIFPSLSREQAYKIIRLIIVFVFSIAFFGIVAWTFLEWKKPANEQSGTIIETIPEHNYTKKAPKIIGIYPNNIFGINQKEGLIESIEFYSDDIEIIHLDFLTSAQMKSELFGKMIDSLTKLLRNENIVAIYGPSITECTDDVLKAVKITGSKVPVFVSSAAPRDFLKWDSYRHSVNLYRISTGIDDRAQSLASFLKQHSTFEKIAVLIETNQSKQKTYGEIFLDQIIRASDNFSVYKQQKKICTYYYDRDNLEEFDSLFNSIKYSFATVFLLGVGDQFEHTVNKYYKGDYPPEKLPKFGGWMFGYSMNDELVKNKSYVVHNKIFEITDLNLSRKYDLDISGNFDVFISKFGGFHPGLRDEACAYDAGICIMSAYKALQKDTKSNPAKYILFDREILEYYNKLISKPKYPVDGISGEIIFSNGLNKSRSLKCAIYDSLNNEWKHIMNTELMEL